jgi:hypothetical protein
MASLYWSSGPDVLTEKNLRDKFAAHVKRTTRRMYVSQGTFQGIKLSVPIKKGSEECST